MDQNTGRELDPEHLTWYQSVNVGAALVINVRLIKSAMSEGNDHEKICCKQEDNAHFLLYFPFPFPFLIPIVKL